MIFETIWKLKFGFNFKLLNLIRIKPRLLFTILFKKIKFKKIFKRGGGASFSVEKNYKRSCLFLALTFISSRV